MLLPILFLFNDNLHSFDSKQSKTGYVDMRFTVDPPRSELVDTISKAIIKGGSQDAYHIEKNSIVFRGK